MTIQLKVPHIGESIQEVQIGQWLKREGDSIAADEDLVELETDKATMELPAPSAGVLKRILKQRGDSVAVGDVIAELEESGGKPAEVKSKSRPESKEPTATAAETPALAKSKSSPEDENVEDVQVVAKERTTSLKPPRRQLEDGEEEIVPMTIIRRRIAARLVEAQHNAALLTTFNEVDMSAVKDLRQKYGEKFHERYGVKLGFMSFFVKAAVDALKAIPVLNAEVRGTDIVYRNFFHMGIAVATDRGLVVPVLRHAERLSFAEVEQAIGELADRARKNKLDPDEITGGTFTISNGGIYGSLLSTPIVNPPQSGVLGMHSIQDRPMALNGAVVIRPMMYIALSYDHRIVDGREAVTFLQRIKVLIEEPSRMLIET